MADNGHDFITTFFSHYGAMKCRFRGISVLPAEPALVPTDLRRMFYQIRP